MIIKNININKLHQELNNADIYPFPVFELENGDGDFTFKDGTDMELVQQLIDAHDPTPLPQPPTDKERLQALEQALLEMVLGGA